MIEIYVDGSSRGNGKSHSQGGFGAVVLRDGKIIDVYSKQFENVTNNQMELLAVLWAIKNYGKMRPIVYSDSSYCVNTFTQWMYGWANKGWIKSDKKVPENLKLVKAYYSLEQKGMKICLKKVSGHSGVKYNEIADKLATGKLKPEEVLKENYEL